MTLADMGVSCSVRGFGSGSGGSAARPARATIPPHDAPILPSVPMIFVMVGIRCPNAQRGPPADPEGGGLPRLLLRGGRGPLLHAVGRLPADRRAGDRDRAAAAR